MAINIPITSTFDDSGLNKAQQALKGIGGPAGKLGDILKSFCSARADSCRWFGACIY